MQTGLNPIDPQQDLMPGAEAANAARAFEFHDDWSLVVTATRYQLEEVKHTSVERGLVRMVITRAGMVTVQALYRMRSAQQRLAIRLPKDAKIDVEPRINNKSVTLETGQQREFFIPLVGQNPEVSFLLELRYTVPGNGRRLECPDFVGEAAVQKVYLAAYVPQEWALLGKVGPWTQEFSWDLDDWGRWQPQPVLAERDLLAWVQYGSNSGAIDTTFPTDGRMYLFSALRPLAPEDGALQMVTMKASWLHGLMFAVVVLGGVLLWPARAGIRVMAVGAFVILLVLWGVFAPTFSRQLLSSVMAAAIVVVGVMWIVAFFRHRPPRRPIAVSPPPAAAPPSPPAATEPTSGTQHGGTTHA
jgi:hypothetical protein